MALSMIDLLSPLARKTATAWLAFTLMTGIPLGLGMTRPAFCETSLTAEVTGALQAGVEAWNAGDLTRFMNGYLKSPDLTFTSSARIIRGYDSLEKRYSETYGTNKQSMGQLRFDQIEVWSLGAESALAMGQWHLEVSNRKGRPKDSMDGVFSLVLRKTADGWKILHDHTSRAEKKP